jgi:hypothetical protein
VTHLGIAPLGLYQIVFAKSAGLAGGRIRNHDWMEKAARGFGSDNS